MIVIEVKHGSKSLNQKLALMCYVYNTYFLKIINPGLQFCGNNSYILNFPNKP